MQKIPLKVPLHVGIIMDGNRRWARRRGLAPVKGHAAGVETIRRVMDKAQEMGVTQLTLYAFSTENWHRTKREVAALFRLMLRAVIQDRLQIIKHRVRFRTIGDLQRLPVNLRKALQELARISQRNNRFILNLAIDYGGRSEIVRAVKRLLVSGAHRDDVTETAIAQHLDTAGQADPDLIIRTGGQQRLSNFLLWQSSYSELYFTRRLWPDFSADDFEQAVREYQRRQRRFGG